MFGLLPTNQNLNHRDTETQRENLVSLRRPMAPLSTPGAQQDDLIAITLTHEDQLALKAALEVLLGDVRRGRVSIEEGEQAELAALLARVGGWEDGPTPRRERATRREYALLAAYVAAAMRLRGYVVGRPQANAYFVGCYRKLRAAAEGERSWWGRLRAWFGL
jgi:hypothetical protein